MKVLTMKLSNARQIINRVTLPLTDPGNVSGHTIENPDEHDIAPVPTTEELLSKIVDLLSRERTVDTETDFLRSMIVPVTTGQTGTVDIPVPYDFGYWHIYRAPASGRVAFGAAFSHPIGEFTAGETLWGKVPRGGVLSLQWDTPDADGQFIIKLGTRPLEFYKLGDAGFTPLANGYTVLADSEYPGVNAIVNGWSAANGPTAVTARFGNADANSGTSMRILDTAAFGYMYNGTTWDRVRGDIANGLDVDPTRLSPGTDQGTFGSLGVTNAAQTISSGLATRKGIKLANNSANPIYWSNTSGVTTATGFLIPANTETEFIPWSGAIWLISTVAGPSDLRYIFFN
jgi:hypothetical protein